MHILIPLSLLKWSGIVNDVVLKMMNTVKWVQAFLLLSILSHREHQLWCYWFWQEDLKEILVQHLATVSSHIQTHESLNEKGNFTGQVEAGICIVCETTIASSAYQVLISFYQL